MTLEENKPVLKESSGSLAGTDNIRFDRRLANRRGWLDRASLEDFIEKLPDVSHKGELISEEDESETLDNADSLASLDMVPHDPSNDFR
ncbi:MAG: hypothetical protein MK240_10830 [Opitutales bacterium]|nr:hypothetical protein [Opitutales bacterium]|tara:strand:+ start:8736 stop:9002 length:267 start_codon:yes stop_codon:yes gene_type:complete